MVTPVSIAAESNLSLLAPAGRAPVLHEANNRTEDDDDDRVGGLGEVSVVGGDEGRSSRYA